MKMTIITIVVTIVTTIVAFSFSVPTGNIIIAGEGLLRKMPFLYLCAAAQKSCSYYGDVRLVNGSNEREGRLEVCIGRVWGTVCDYGWRYSFARVVCRQLGYEVDQGAGVFNDFYLMWTID